ncbi:MAG TPA: AAA family ATPase [Candidatus Aminicenantes bacterium]|nr:AAA family ATPase [Candidatus Aminicenantes bacterium]
MDHLVEKFRRKVDRTRLDFVRGAMDVIPWQSRMVAIRGARGVGKTTLLLQYIKRQLPEQLDRTLYVSLDDLWFAGHSLTGLADEFVKKGGLYLFLDEVHKLPRWSRAIKNIYDDHPDLKIVFTGSSLLETLDARADLSRRAVVYNMAGLSFREYLNMQAGTDFSALTLAEILKKNETMSASIVRRIKPLRYFPGYLRGGYYPYFLEDPDTYLIRLEETVNMILELELPLLRAVDMAYVPKLKRLMGVITESAPFLPNISKLSERIGINRNTLINYLRHLQDAGLINALYKKAPRISALQKPNKLYLENTNLMALLKSGTANVGTMRETFLANQLLNTHEVHYPHQGDFLVDGTITFEVGGKSKSSGQIKRIDQAYIAADDIEYGHGKTIPLWLLGFLY